MGATDWFVAAAVSGSACAGMALMVVVIGWCRRLADVAVVGASLYGLSALMTASALVATGASGVDRQGELAGVLAVPVGLAIATPIVLPHRTGAVRRRWRAWSAAALGVVSVVAAATAPTRAEVPVAVVVVTTLAGAGGLIALVRRQLLLYQIARRPSMAVAVAGLTVLGVSALAGPWVTPGSASAWMLLIADNAGLLASAGALLVGYRTGRDVSDVLAPLVSHDPCAALDIGLAPEIEAFVAALGRKDTFTREHVIRTSATALHAAARAGLPARVVREVAIGALLHDIGKLVIPSAIIGKTGSLTDDEYATIRTHPEQGERLLRDTPTLAAAAPYVRGHHERHDGHGYPDGLAGDRIPLGVALVSVADAWDAMTNTRQYRSGMAADRARAILADGSGTQWHPEAVRWLLAVADEHLPDSDPAATILTGPPRTVDAVDCATDHLAEPNRPSVAPRSVHGPQTHECEQQHGAADDEHDGFALPPREDREQAAGRDHEHDLGQRAGVGGGLHESAHDPRSG